MKKKTLSVLTATLMGAALLAGCAVPAAAPEAAQAQEAQAADTAETAEEAAAEAETAPSEEASTEAAESAEEASTEAAEATTEDAADAADSSVQTQSARDLLGFLPASETEVRVGSLQGPTTMGLVNLMKASEKGEAEGKYNFKMSSQPDEIVADIAGGNLDIALVPANLASVLYNKTEGGVEVININTLGVLYCVTGDDSVQSVADLAGKTIVTTGQGATPEYALNYLLEKNGITDAALEFKSEATEIAALLQEDPSTVAVLPQPFATVATLQNENVHEAFSLTDEWDAISDGSSRFLTGVTIVRKAFLESNENDVIRFLAEQENSVMNAVADPAATGELVAEYGIVAKAKPAQAALPKCGLVCIENAEMKSALSGYLQTLFDQNPKAVGGKLPADDFYYDFSAFQVQ